MRTGKGHFPAMRLVYDHATLNVCEFYIICRITDSLGVSFFQHRLSAVLIEN